METKFNIEESVWTLNKNRAEELKICSIGITNHLRKGLNITYTLSKSGTFSADEYFFSKEENEIFKTKQELLDSL